LIFGATVNNSQLLSSVVAWPDVTVEQPCSDRPLKRTYAVAGQFIENHSICKTLTVRVIARFGRLRHHSKRDEVKKIR
jgi:hypothetical protein